MYRALTPTALTAAAACHRCRTPLVVGAQAWRARVAEGDRSWLCLPCGRPFATGRPGRSAELEAMRRMRSEPLVEEARTLGGPRSRPAPRRRGDASPAVPLPAAPGRAGAQRWGRRLVLSLLLVFASSPLTAAGPGGKVLAVAIGGPAAVLFWVSAVGLLITGLRSRWTSPPQPPPSQWQARPPAVVTDASRPPHGPLGGGRVRIAGAEDNWVKGVRGEHAVGAALNGTGLPVLHDRRLREGSDANIDHLLVAADAVYVIDAKNLGGSLAAGSAQLRMMVATARSCLTECGARPTRLPRA
jgi:hypothetical protein